MVLQRQPQLHILPLLLRSWPHASSLDNHRHSHRSSHTHHSLMRLLQIVQKETRRTTQTKRIILNKQRHLIDQSGCSRTRQIKHRSHLNKPTLIPPEKKHDSSSTLRLTLEHQSISKDYRPNLRHRSQQLNLINISLIYQSIKSYTIFYNISTSASNVHRIKTNLSQNRNHWKRNQHWSVLRVLANTRSRYDWNTQNSTMSPSINWKK